MKRILYALIISVFILFAAGSLYAQQPPKANVVVATTSWTAAFVRAAGFTGTVHVLAPASLQHPPEYELKPSDILAASSADYIVFAGYERMASQLKEAVAKKNVIMVQIATDYSLPTLRGSVNKLAELFGTKAAADANLKLFEDYFSGLKEELKKAGVFGGGIICHVMQIPFLKELGFSIKGTYGPAPLEPKELGNLSGYNPVIIIDNWHNPVAKPLKDLYSKTPVAVFINFPGHDGTGTLTDVLTYNRKELLKALGL